jgi:hypothetical protein
MNKLTENEFETNKEYQLQINHIVRSFTNSSIADEDICSFGGCMYETFGEELNYVFSLRDKNRVLTIIEGDGEDEKVGSLFITTGFHYVNRIGFLVLEKPYEEEFEVELEF